MKVQVWKIMPKKVKGKLVNGEKTPFKIVNISQKDIDIMNESHDNFTNGYKLRWEEIVKEEPVKRSKSRGRPVNTVPDIEPEEIEVIKPKDEK